MQGGQGGQGRLAALQLRRRQRPHQHPPAAQGGGTTHQQAGDQGIVEGRRQGLARDLVDEAQVEA
jgi:hypothetical protein